MYDVRPGPTFKRQFKDILKKYPKLKNQLRRYFEEVERTGPKGKRIPEFNVLWKDRLPIEAYNIGEQGGIRFICYYNEEFSTTIAAPVLIYLKSEMENPPRKMMKNAVKELEAFLGDSS